MIKGSGQNLTQNRQPTQTHREALVCARHADGTCWRAAPRWGRRSQSPLRAGGSGRLLLRWPGWWGHPGQKARPEARDLCPGVTTGPTRGCAGRAGTPERGGFGCKARTELQDPWRERRVPEGWGRRGCARATALTPTGDAWPQGQVSPPHCPSRAMGPSGPHVTGLMSPPET